MREIDATSAGSYLVEAGHLPRGARPRCVELAGGVSNIVLRVEAEGHAPFVLKQCRERLRVAMDWRAPLARIWYETAALSLLCQILPAGQVPRVLFEDRPEYLFAMTCAPDNSVTWKSLLMEGRFDPGLARAVGTALAAIHEGCARHPALASTFADRSHFFELRIDPYYGTTAAAHPALAPQLAALVASMDQPDISLVLGDYSPKNILVHRDGIVLLDFECAHAGDPAFDIGFCLSHLLLKLCVFRDRPGAADVARGFVEGYAAGAVGSASDKLEARMRRAASHAAACMLARLDGKSPVDYRDELDQEAVRRLARSVLERQQRWSCNELVDAAVQEVVP